MSLFGLLFGLSGLPLQLDAGLDYWTFRWRYTSEVVAATEFGHLPVIVATNPHPAGVATKVPKIVTCDRLEDSRHIAHEGQRIELFDVEPLLSPATFHGIHEGLTVLPLPTTKGHWSNLVGIVTANNV